MTNQKYKIGQEGIEQMNSCDDLFAAPLGNSSGGGENQSGKKGEPALYNR